LKIGFTGIDLPEGKIKYQDKYLIALAGKDNPKKVTPYFMELIQDDFTQAEAIIVPKDKILDILIYDLEKMEARLERSDDSSEKVLIKKYIKILENETPLCDAEFDKAEQKILKTISPFSLKPVVQVEETDELNSLFTETFEKANRMFFYTSGQAESHAWIVKKGSDIVTCAGKIHTDLARGFIRGDVVSFEEYMTCHNFNDCKSKGKARVVDKEYIVQPNEVIEIRFNV